MRLNPIIEFLISFWFYIFPQLDIDKLEREIRESLTWKRS